MSDPVSLPVIRPQPAVEFYSTQELALFKTYTRDSYRAAFGVEAPPFDTSRPAKSWFDSSADTSHPGNVAMYKIVGREAGGSPAIRQLVLPASEAKWVNLTGTVPYPVYIVLPTSALRRGPGNLTPQPVNPDYLSAHADAAGLMFEIGGTAVREESPMGGGFGIAYPANENRRLWDITFNGRDVNAGLLLKNKNVRGVGAPGQWDLTGEEPVWVAAPPAPGGLDETGPGRELPVRDLLENEQLQATLMSVGVVRTDLRDEAGKELGQFTKDDRALLLAIYQVVVDLRVQTP